MICLCYHKVQAGHRFVRDARRCEVNPVVWALARQVGICARWNYDECAARLQTHQITGGNSMRKLMLFLAALLLTSVDAGATPLTIVGTYHCSNDGCGWNSVRNMTDFDTQNHWLIDRGDGSGQPSVNLVVLSFANPTTVLNNNAFPVGMT